MSPVRGFTGWVGTVLGTPDPVGLAEFYRGVLGGEVDERDGSFVTLRVDSDSAAYLAFQLEGDPAAVAASGVCHGSPPGSGRPP